MSCKITDIEVRDEEVPWIIARLLRTEKVSASRLASVTLADLCLVCIKRIVFFFQKYFLVLFLRNSIAFTIWVADSILDDIMA